jgi:hypothetical protein
MPDDGTPAHPQWHEEKVRMMVEIERLQKENEVLRENIKKIGPAPWTREQGIELEELRYKNSFMKDDNSKLNMMFRTIAAILKEYIDDVE